MVSFMVWCGGWMCAVDVFPVFRRFFPLGFQASLGAFRGGYDARIGQERRRLGCDGAAVLMVLARAPYSRGGLRLAGTLHMDGEEAHLPTFTQRRQADPALRLASERDALPLQDLVEGHLASSFLRSIPCWTYSWVLASRPGLRAANGMNRRRRMALRLGWVERADGPA